MPAGIFPPVEGIANEQAIAHLSHNERMDLFEKRWLDGFVPTERRKRNIKELREVPEVNLFYVEVFYMP